jgi:hypothetical protein
MKGGGRRVPDDWEIRRGREDWFFCWEGMRRNDPSPLKE